MALFDTAGQIINDAAVELGLAAVVDPFASTDPNFIQLVGLLKTVGRQLVRTRQWKHLEQQYSFPATDGTAPLPPGFAGFIDQTIWDENTHLPVAGPLTPQEWQYVQEQNLGASTTLVFDPSGGLVLVYPFGPTTSISFWYRSAWFTQPLGAGGPTQEVPTAASDTICFDPLLVTRALKLAWLKAKGFDATAAKDDFDSALMMAASMDASPVLNLNGSMRMGKLLGPDNIPLTGFGS